MDHTKVPIWDKVNDFQKQEHVWLHVPTHSGGSGLPQEVREAFLPYARYDLTELPGLDDLFNPSGIIADAQGLAADVWGALATYFVVNGASAGVRAMIEATCNPGDTVLIARNAHKSLYEALIFTGVSPQYLPVLTAEGIGLNVTAETVKEGFKRFPQAKALYLTSPSYHGVTADLERIAQLSRDAGALLLVDEAHGGHLGFHLELPQSAGRYCDLRVQSWHKTIGALTPGAVLHCHSERVDRRRLMLALQGVQTTSPPYPVLASLDVARKRMALSGEAVVAEMLDNAKALRKTISSYLPLLTRHELGDVGFALDETRITMLTAKAGLCGLSAGQYLASCGIELELIQPNYLLALIGPGYHPNWTQRVEHALKHIPKNGLPAPFKSILPALPAVVLTPREAYFHSSSDVTLQDAIDAVAAAPLLCYPPGIPLVVAGERITREVVDYIECARAHGVIFHGVDNHGQVRVCR